MLQQIIHKEVEERKPVITLDRDTNLYFRKIYLAEKNDKQAILLYREGTYFWTCFYLDRKHQLSYNSIEEAVKAIIQKGYNVFMLDNKCDLKEMIKFRGAK